MNLDKQEADLEDSKTVVKICTEYAQSGMWNIFIALMAFTLAFALFDPNFFVAYLVSIAVFGLFQAIFMANAGGSWDNAKKVVEVDLKMKGTPLHDATVVGDTVGDPFKDTSSVALNPVIKFTTLFGLLAVELAVSVSSDTGQFGANGLVISRVLAAVFFLISLYFVWRSFHKMRIGSDPIPTAAVTAYGGASPVRYCPKCRQSYTDPTLQHCLEHGERLVDRLDAADLNATHILPGETVAGRTVPSSGSREDGH
ncbi:MAG TPA: sodium/proton-translocating pyrophosphatase [Pyrinomonadaceae bacterium]|nr:sodium/proton-translocating pyrophosphatase [Pyrinomonadaceae bacterium]